MKIWTFFSLQWADYLTTFLFLSLGVSEGNPLVSGLMHASSPLIGLGIVKAVCMVVGYWCYESGRYATLAKMNVVFSLVVGWNVLAIASRGIL